MLPLRGGDDRNLLLSVLSPFRNKILIDTGKKYESKHLQISFSSRAINII